MAGKRNINAERSDGPAVVPGRSVERVRALIEPVTAALGLELVQVEVRGEGRGRVLRVTIDKPEGITLSDCEDVSRELNPLLDRDDPLPGTGYTLEVSSPGLDRPLTRPADFTRFAGQRARVHTLAPDSEGRRNYTGELLGVEDGAVRMRLEGGREVAIQWDNIEGARLAPTWPQVRKPGH